MDNRESVCTYTKTRHSTTPSTPGLTVSISLTDAIKKLIPTMERSQAWQKNTVFPVPEAKTFQLEDGSIRIQVGDFWKVVSSWHLADVAENQLIHAYRTHHS